LRGPHGRAGNAYGGLLFAQSLQAAQMTVDSTRFIPHSVHSFFIINVDSTKTVDYGVENVRDGRSFATRFVTAKQAGKVAM
jgi:acyl-CoA thioesterase II